MQNRAENEDESDGGRETVENHPETKNHKPGTKPRIRNQELKTKNPKLTSIKKNGVDPKAHPVCLKPFRIS
jgi:hypothetical protein